MIDRIGSRTSVGTASTSGAPPITAKDKRNADLKKVAGQLEGVFVLQLFKAMRDTVPQEEGIVSGGSGEDIFNSLMDEHLAAETPKHWEGSLGQALYRQLQSIADKAAPAAAVTPSVSTNP